MNRGGSPRAPRARGRHAEEKTIRVGPTTQRIGVGRPRRIENRATRFFVGRDLVGRPTAAIEMPRRAALLAEVWEVLLGYGVRGHAPPTLGDPLRFQPVR